VWATNDTRILRKVNTRVKLIRREYRSAHSAEGFRTGGSNDRLSKGMRAFYAQPILRYAASLSRTDELG